MFNFLNHEVPSFLNYSVLELPYSSVSDAYIGSTSGSVLNNDVSVLSGAEQVEMVVRLVA